MSTFNKLLQELVITLTLLLKALRLFDFFD